MRKILLTLLLLAPAPYAAADDLYDQCMDKALTNLDFAHCGGEWMARADVKLNDAWKALNASLEGYEASKRELLAEQRLWNAYKEKSCLFYSHTDFGRQGDVLEFPVCRAGVIERRIKELNSYHPEIH